MDVEGVGSWGGRKFLYLHNIRWTIFGGVGLKQLELISGMH